MPAGADPLRLRQEIGLPTGIEPVLDLGAALENATPLRTEFAFEVRDESYRLGRQHPLAA